MSMDSNGIRRTNIPGISYSVGQSSGKSPSEVRKGQVTQASYNPAEVSKQPHEHPKMPEDLAPCPGATALYLATVGRAMEHSLQR